jgi:hypothetical protein
LAPTYQEFAVGCRVIAAKSLLCRPQPSSAVRVGSIVVKPRSRRSLRQSAIQSTCCSMDTDMLDSTEGLSGPVIMNRLGKPTDCRPR